MTPPVAFVLKGYPRLSETFIAQEIRALEQRGLDIRIVSLRPPYDRDTHPVHRQIRAPVCYLPEYLHGAPRRVVAAWRRVRGRPGYAEARRAWVRDLLRDPTRNRIRRFGQALVLAAELPADVRHLHAHFLHTPSSVTRYAAMILELPWSASAHAKDVWTTPEWDLREKLADCRWLVSCTEANVAHLKRLAPDPERVRLVYHGLDLARFSPPHEPRPARSGDDPEDPVVILSVGRAVAKKGYGVLIDALARLPDAVSWRLVHIGGGPELPSLRARAGASGLADRITWLGPQAQEAVIAQYRAADLFVLASRIAEDGDRDGLPNVLMEAQSQALACAATRVSAIPELIIDGKTGLLVPPEDPDSLAEALLRLIRAPELRARLGAAGLTRVRSAFSLADTIDQLADRFGIASAPDRRCASSSMHP